jgi:hypothetical protein
VAQLFPSQRWGASLDEFAPLLRQLAQRVEAYFPGAQVSASSHACIILFDKTVAENIASYSNGGTANAITENVRSRLVKQERRNPRCRNKGLQQDRWACRLVGRAYQSTISLPRFENRSLVSAGRRLVLEKPTVSVSDALIERNLRPPAQSAHTA